MAAKVELPFLFQTRTILRQSRTRLRSPSLRRCLGTHQPQQEHQHQLVEADPKNASTLHAFDDKTFLQRKASSLFDYDTPISASNISSSIKTHSTITPSERKAFETILRFPHKATQPKSIKKQSPFIDAVDTDVDTILDIINLSLKTHSAEKPTDSAPSVADSGPVEQAPQSKDHHLVDELAESLDPVLYTPATKKLIRARVDEIVQVLEAATASTDQPGDIALWRVCEEKIFSLGQQLKLDSYKPPRFVGPRKFTFTAKHSDVPVEILNKEHERLRVKFETKTLTNPASDPEIIPVPPGSDAENENSIDTDSRQALAIVHHVYPAALLYALRLFAKKFPSSQLAYNLLPRIHKLGRTSYVLGASSQFYNTLIAMKWRASSSLREIDALLVEMESGGVELNEETYRILRYIEDERIADVEKKESGKKASPPKSSRGAAWWSRHEQAFWYPKILTWLIIVGKRLREQDIRNTPDTNLQHLEAEESSASVKPLGES